MSVKRGSYYTWKAAEPDRAAKAAEDEALTSRIREIHHNSRCTYGAKRVALDLAEAGAGPVNHKKVARLMRQAGIEGRHQRRRRALTKQDKTATPAPDLLGRDFTACAPNVKWCGSGSRREFHPPAPTEPCVTVSRYTALATLITRSCGTNASGRTSSGIAV